MQVATISGYAVISLSLLVGPGLLITSPAANRGGGSYACTGTGVCTPVRRDCTFPGSNSIWPTVAADLPDGVSSDGRGPYLKGKDGVIDSRAGQEATMTIWDRADTVKNARSFTVNLSKPVPGGGGVPLGINPAGNGSGFVTQRGMVGDTVRNMLNIAVGQTETAAMMSITFHINGRRHVLQMGPLANGHCMGPKNLVHGSGTSSGTISRVSPAKWVMDLPAGSIGRLFDMQDSWDHAVDKGLYYVHLHYEIGK